MPRPKKVTAMQFLPRIKGKRQTESLTVDDFRSLHHKRHGDRAFHHQEYLKGAGRYCIYYDWDDKRDGEPPPPELAACFSDFKATVARLHPDTPDTSFRWAQRHGWVSVAGGGRKYKVSYRAWVRTVYVERPSHIVDRIRRVLELGAKGTHAQLDTTVFKDAEQLVAVIGGCKDTDDGKEEPRWLTPISADGEVLAEGTYDPADYLIQNVPDGAVLLPRPGGTSAGGSVAAAAAGKKRGRKPAASPTGETTGGPSGQRGSAEGGDKTDGADGDEDAVTTEVHPDAFSAATRFFGEKFWIMREKLTKAKVDRERGCLIFPTRDRWCYIKRDTHEQNNPYIVLTDTAGARFKCPDDQCKAAGEVKAIPMRELPQPLRDLYATVFHPTVDKELIKDAKEDARRNIRDEYPDEDPKMEDVEQVKDTLMTLAQHRTCFKCKSNKTSFVHKDEGYRIVCLDCEAGWPRKYVAFDKAEYPKLLQALTALNISIGTVNINNNNQQITNIYNSEAQVDFYADFTPDAIIAFPDNPELNALFIGALQGTDSSLSRFATVYFKDRFHCTDDRRWFKYRGHCWHEKAADLAYKEALQEDGFLEHFRRTALFFENLPIQTEEVKRKARMVRKLAVALEDGKHRERIVTDSIMKFHETRPTFTEELDTQNVLCFSNGIFSFDDFSFGPGSPDIPISMHVEHSYHPYDPENEHVQFLESFMRDILPDDSVRLYALKVLGICLTLDTSLQRFFIWTGAGGNGKGRLVSLMEECLGDYFQSLSPSMLTRKREDASSANEALMTLVRARIVVFQEPEAHECIQASVLKSLTGEDTLSSRQNYGKQTKFRPKTKPIMVCNDLPRLSETTQAMIRRLVCIHFPSAFVETPTQPHERKIDYHLDEKLRAAAPYFIGMLIHYWRRYKSEGLAQPDEVTKVTKRYLKDNDIVAQFVEDCLERHLIDGEPSKYHVIVASDLPGRFQRWYRENVSSKGPPKTATEAVKTSFGLTKTFNWDKTSTFLERLGYEPNSKAVFRGWMGWSWIPRSR
jgi:P4 family phage/plasmid primase-like protien